ncbi:MAG: hypothetical protein P4L81_03295 [Candidatus Pacebacteria bacterium]|nr:hypothetical protein [Candidatus Paceibacterota bacterium]
MTFVLIIVGLLVALGIAIGVIYNLIFDDEDFETSPEAVQLITEDILRNGNPNGRFYDLGSCYGTMAIRMQAAIPTLHITAIEKSLFRHLVAKGRCLFKRNKPKFVWGNFLDHLDEPAEYKNIYLPRDFIREFEDRLSRACPPTTIFMYRVQFYKKEPAKVLPLSGFEQDTREVFRIYR